MLLMEYAKSKGILKVRKATVLEVRPLPDGITVIYKVEGQKYTNEQYSAKTLTKAEAASTEVDENTGELLSGTVYKKNNFWCWKPSESSDEA